MPNPPLAMAGCHVSTAYSPSAAQLSQFPLRFRRDLPNGSPHRPTHFYQQGKGRGFPVVFQHGNVFAADRRPGSQLFLGQARLLSCASYLAANHRRKIGVDNPRVCELKFTLHGRRAALEGVCHA